MRTGIPRSIPEAAALTMRSRVSSGPDRVRLGVAVLAAVVAVLVATQPGLRDAASLLLAQVVRS
jgi:hypothetical protein